MTQAFKKKSSSLTESPYRNFSEWSPKFSLLYQKTPHWDIRYSAAIAHRFPLSEELFGNFETLSSTVIADANLKPERGLHHSLSHFFYFKPSTLRLTFFYDDVQNTIFNLTDTALNKTTFLNIDEVSTKGVECAYEHRAFLWQNFDVELNASYQSSVIEENSPDPSLEGNRFPRSPRWRVNTLMSLEHTPQFSSSLGFRYSSNQYGRLQNDDHGSGYSAVDAFFITDLKFNYRLGGGFSISAGVDNLFDREAFVSHPYPQRTFFLGGKWQG
jgi:iron complex outermembrane receptor protein